MPPTEHLAMRNMILLSDEEFIERVADALFRRMQQSGANNAIPPSNQKWLTHAEAAAYLKKSLAALYQLSASRAVKFTKRGKQNYYRVEDLDIYMEGGMVKTTTEIVKEVQLTQRKNYSLTKLK